LEAFALENETMPIAIIIAAYVVAADITANTVVSIVNQIKHPCPCKSVCVQVKVLEDSTATK